MNYSKHDIAQLDERFRAQLINSLSGFKSANLIGTKDKDGLENLSIVSSVFHIGSNPPLIGMIIRPHSVPRHTLENIKQTGGYTINHVNREIFTAAHQTSARYEKEQSEFKEVGLTSCYLNNFIAPYVLESKCKMAIELRSLQTLELNQTELVIGEIVDIHLDDKQAVTSDGHIDLNSLDTVALSGLDAYHTAESLGRLKYAKPDQDIEFLDKK